MAVGVSSMVISITPDISDATLSASATVLLTASFVASRVSVVVFSAVFTVSSTEFSVTFSIVSFCSFILSLAVSSMVLLSTFSVEFSNVVESVSSVTIAFVAFSVKSNSLLVIFECSKKFSLDLQM